MPYIRYVGQWEDVAIDRHNVVSNHRLDTDELTVAYIPECVYVCWYWAPNHRELRPGEEVITKAQFESEGKAIQVSNAALVPREPVPSERELARERELAAIIAHKDTDWGAVLYDKAIADGRIEA